MVIQKFNNEKENNLSIRRSQLVSKRNLSQISKKLNLHKSIIIDKNINISDRIHCDIFESLIGAIYLDSNFKEVKKIWIISHLILLKQIIFMISKEH